MTHAATKSVAAGEPELRWSNLPRLGIHSSNARDHLAAMSSACEQALAAADQVHPVVRGKKGDA
jgi:hypothetical protein